MQPLNPTFMWVGKNLHPELTSTVTRIINESWKDGECKDSGKVKISADCVFDRPKEMQASLKIIRLVSCHLLGRFVVYTKA